MPLSSGLPPPAPFPKPNKVYRTPAFVALVLAFYYLWLVAPQSPRTWTVAEPTDYPNLLARGFSQGSLALDVPDQPELAKLRDPRDPKERGTLGYNDTAYYQGKFYLYFGPPPIVALLWPFYALTGTFLALPIAVACFAWLGTIGWLCAAERVRADWFPEVGRGVSALVGLVLGAGNMLPILLRLPEVYELAIVSAYAGIGWAVYASYRAAFSGQARWFALASLALGWAIASRPTWLVAGLLLLAPLWVVWRHREELEEASSGWWGRLCAAAGPLLLIGAAVAWYNWARFGNPLEFGFKYQLTYFDERGVKFFNPGNVTYNFFVYFLNPPTWTDGFPYLASAEYPERPAGHFGDPEDPFGVLVGVPWIFLGLLLLRWRREQPGEMGVLALAWLGTALAITLFTCGFGGCTVRYQTDLTPLWVWLGALGALSWLGTATPGWPRRVRVLVLSLLGVLSLGFNWAIAVQHKTLLENQAPQAFRTVSDLFDTPRALWLRAHGEQFGPLALEVTFPPVTEKHLEVLVGLGNGKREEALFVRYTRLGRGQLGYYRRGQVVELSPEFDLRPGVVRRLYLNLSALQAPPLVGDNRLGAWPTVVVRLDDRLILRTAQPGEARRAWAPRFGHPSDEAGIILRPFTGTLGRAERVAIHSDDPRSRWPERARLELALPETLRERVEPLWEVPLEGGTEVLCIRYGPTGKAQLGLASGLQPIVWGRVLSLSEGRLLALEVELPRRPGEPLVAWERGGPVALRSASRLAEGDPARWVIGEAWQPWGQGVWNRFRGRFLQVEWTPPE